MQWSYSLNDVIEVGSGFHKGLVGQVVHRKKFFWYIVQYGNFPFNACAKIPVWRMRPHSRKPEHRLLATLKNFRESLGGKELLCTKSTFDQLEAEMQSADVVRVVEMGSQLSIYGIAVRVDDRVAHHPSRCQFVDSEEIDCV